MKELPIFQRKIQERILSILSLFVLVLSVWHYSSAEMMQSSSYSIQSDSINIGGGASSSTNYGLEDSVGEVGTGVSSSANYINNAGYQQMQETYLALSSPSDVALASMSGLVGGTSNGQASWTVTTDNIPGYTLQIKSSTSPAMTSSADSFANYTPSSSDPDYTFSISTSASAFGFSPEGSDTASRFKNNGSICATGSLSTASVCWAGFSTSDQTIAQRSSGNHPGGVPTIVHFRAQSGTAHIQTSGAYSATITVTAVAL